MESHGFAVNVEKMREIRSQAETNATILASELRIDFDEERLNLGSPQQLVDAFKEAGVELMIPASRLFALWMIHVRRKFWLGELKPNSLQASKRFCAPNDQAVFTPLSTRWVP